MASPGAGFVERVVRTHDVRLPVGVGRPSGHPSGAPALSEAARMACRGLRVNRLRSALTALGVVIGTAAVIVLVALGNGVQAAFSQAFGSLATQITVTPSVGSVPGGGVARDLTDADVTALRDPARAPAVASATPVTTGTALLQLGPRRYRTSVVGTTPDYLPVTARTLVVGSFISPEQARAAARVVVLGPNPVAELFGGEAGAALGRQIRIDRSQFTVIGVLKGDGQSDDAVVVPLDAARAYLLGAGDVVDRIIVKAVDASAVPAATNQLTTILDDRHRIREPAKRDFEARALQNLIERSTQFLTFLTVFTGAVAAISLVVGAIGVANIMLVAVTERTREIGVRKAVGATRRAILSQFLIEAITLTGLGGLIGILAGIGLSVLGGVLLPNAVPNFPAPEVSTGSVLVAFVVSLVIGVVAGMYPAARAARLRPIQALRYE